MQTETATLFAVLAAPLAVLAVVLAIATLLVVRRGRRSLIGTADRLEVQRTAIREELVGFREAIEQAGPVIARLREDEDRFAHNVTDWTASLADGREALQRLTRGRMGPVVRAVQVAGVLARIALLWRAPVR